MEVNLNLVSKTIIQIHNLTRDLVAMMKRTLILAMVALLLI